MCIQNFDEIKQMANYNYWLSCNEYTQFFPLSLSRSLAAFFFDWAMKIVFVLELHWNFKTINSKMVDIYYPLVRSIKFYFNFTLLKGLLPLWVDKSRPILWINVNISSIYSHWKKGMEIFRSWKRNREKEQRMWMEWIDSY